MPGYTIPNLNLFIIYSNIKLNIFKPLYYNFILSLSIKIIYIYIYIYIYISFTNHNYDYYIIIIIINILLRTKLMKYNLQGHNYYPSAILPNDKCCYNYNNYGPITNRWPDYKLTGPFQDGWWDLTL